jgi:hypothetical protein
LATLVVPSSAVAQSGPAQGWLNALDCGVSGSEFETTATTAAGSNRITLKTPGDFRVGQGVMVSRSNVRYLRPTLWGPGEPYRGASHLAGVEMRGYDGSSGSWTVYLLEVDSAGPTFRWSDDLARTWKARKVPVTFDWQPLSGGTEVRFSRRDWQPGHMVSFTARDQLVTRITAIEGRTLTLAHAANRTAADAVVRHCDNAALQLAIDRAVKEHRNLFLPVGRYRLAAGLRVQQPAGLVIEGQSSVDTVIDITDGEGACFALYRGSEVTLRNMAMLGHTGLAEQPGAFRTSSGFGFWACTLKTCSAVTTNGTERVLVENVHARRMASECFISYGPYRTGNEEPKEYTRSATYQRCSVTDCAANAFNNCDFAENTSILYCRIDGAGWHAYEGSGRFVRLIGNYVRNAGPFTVGDIPHTLPRLEHFHELGIGQAVVANNVFEGIGRCGGVTVIFGPTQVVVADNLFVNYNGNAITAACSTVHNCYPSQNITIRGNIIDMTVPSETPRGRNGISVEASDTIVADNQVYTRGATDPRVIGICIREGAVNVNVHDNLVRNCGRGIYAHRVPATVTEVVDPATFRQTGLPLEWRHSHLYRGWNLAWLNRGLPASLSIVDRYDPDTLAFKLREPRALKAGDAFQAFPAESANWSIHDNTLTGCSKPVVLDCFGSESTIFKGNLVTRGQATGAAQAVKVSGRANLVDNHISGFDEPASTALALTPDPLGRVCPNVYQDNVIDDCARALSESRPGLWAASRAHGNLFLRCGNVPPAAGKQ